MTGTVTTIKGTTYVFRDDHGYEPCIWAWDIHATEDRAVTHKWKRIPKEAVVDLFDIDKPPRTVAYIPMLA